MHRVLTGVPKMNRPLVVSKWCRSSSHVQRMSNAWRWLGEVPRVLALLPLLKGLRPLMNLRFGAAKSAQVKVRRVGTLTIPDRVSAMVFVNIWIRQIYPRPRDGDVVLDLGANVGLFSVLALHQRAKFCHCVEPCPDSVARLREHFSRLGLQDRSNVMPVAIGVEAGTAYIPSVSAVSNTVNREMQPGLVPVPMHDAARLIESLKPVPTYLKLDIESHEVVVLRRLMSSPAFATVRTVAVEIMKDEEMIASMLRQAGFAIHMLTSPEIIVTGRR